MTARVICMASAKGGSGKTVLTATFGSFLTAVGKKALLVDTDAATNGLTLFFIKEVRRQGEYAISEGREPRGVYDFVTSAAPPEVVELAGGLHLVPATYEFKNSESVPSQDYARSLSHALALLRDRYDYILLDAQAGSDVFAQIAMSKKMSDEVVIVSEYDPMSAAGVERLKGLFREELTYVRTWVLLNKMLPEFVQSFSDFLEVAKYLSPIPWDADVVRAYARRRLALDPDNGNEHTLAVLQTVKSLFGDELSTELNHWIAKRATAIREPIAQQYMDAEIELESLLKEQYLSSQKNLSRRLIISVVIYVSFTLIAMAFGFWFWRTDLRWFGIGAAGAGVVVSLFAVKFMEPSLRSFAPSIESNRIKRRVEAIQDRLRKLETLRSADLETLIKEAGRKHS